MADQIIATPACLLTIFGASGDLTKRLLLPSLYNLVAAKVLPERFRLLGVAAEGWSDDLFRDHIGQSLQEFWGADADPAVVAWLQSRAFYRQANFDQPASFDALAQAITEIETKETLSGNRVFFLAVAPSFISTIATQLARTGLVEQNGEPWRRLVIEKPFGSDLASAIALNTELQSSLREEQIYRIDHFAGKDSVQDLAVFRFSNAVIEPLWHRSLVDSVQITVAETVGVEKRAGYYDKAGAIRDMVPNHLAEVLSLIAMEPPVSFNAKPMRDKQVELLSSIRRMKPADVDTFAVRGQYGAGSIHGKPVPGYRDEPGVAPGSTTETYVAMRVEIDNWRWSGVPFYLRTGKRMTRALTEVIVTFRQPPAKLFPNAARSDQAPNELNFNLQPDQQISMSFGARSPGMDTVVEQQAMSFRFPSGPFGTHGHGYERLLRDVMIGNSTLFQSAQFVEQGWTMVQPLLEAWNNAPAPSFPNYEAGTAGPSAADSLLKVNGHLWRSLES